MANPFQQWFHADFLRVCKRKKLNFAQKSAYSMFLHELWECQGYLDTDPYELAHQLGLKSSDCLCPFTSDRLSDPQSMADSIAKALLKNGLIQVASHPETGDECYCQDRILEDMGKISSKSKVNSNNGKIGALVKNGIIVKDSKTKSYRYVSNGEKFNINDYLGKKDSDGLSDGLENGLSKGVKAYHNHNHNHIKNKEIESVGSFDLPKQIESQKHTHTQNNFDSMIPSLSEITDHALVKLGAFRPFKERLQEFFDQWDSCGWIDANHNLINWRQRLMYFLKEYDEKNKKPNSNASELDKIAQGIINKNVGIYGINS